MAYPPILRVPGQAAQASLTQPAGTAAPAHEERPPMSSLPVGAGPDRDVPASALRPARRLAARVGDEGFGSRSALEMGQGRAIAVCSLEPTGASAFRRVITVVGSMVMRFRWRHWTGGPDPETPQGPS